jgi:hypothetical protein
MSKMGTIPEAVSWVVIVRVKWGTGHDTLSIGPGSKDMVERGWQSMGSRKNANARPAWTVWVQIPLHDPQQGDFGPVTNLPVPFSI